MKATYRGASLPIDSKTGVQNELSNNYTGYKTALKIDEVWYHGKLANQGGRKVWDLQEIKESDAPTLYSAY